MDLIEIKISFWIAFVNKFDFSDFIAIVNILVTATVGIWVVNVLQK